MICLTRWRSSWTTTWPASSATRGASPSIRPRGSTRSGTASSRRARRRASDSSSPRGTAVTRPRTGRAVSDMLQVDWPTSSPWVTSVGGTSLAIGPFDNYEFETSWGTLLDPLASNGRSWQYTPPGLYPDWYDGSSGGGVSTYFPQPPYQAGVVPYSLATAVPEGSTSTPMRVVPDVSALADPSTGFLVGQTTLQPNGTTYAFSLSRIGGTSVSCPTFAGIEADAQQAAGHPLGFANPAIYRRYGTDAFRDVTDHPFGIAHLAEVRNNYTDPSTKTGPARHVPAHAGHRRRRRRRIASGGGLRRFHRRRIARSLHRVVPGARPLRRQWGGGLQPAAPFTTGAAITGSSPFRAKPDACRTAWRRQDSTP